MFPFKKNALSIIELVVVVAIIGIISASSLVSIDRSASLKLEGQTRMIVGDLTWARELAVSQHDDFIVQFDTANESYIIYKGSIGGTIYKNRKLEVDIVSVVPAPEDISFYFPDGTSQSKQVNLSYRGNTRQVNIFDETGYVKF
ncbi:MAG: prepilin-type N-terminal cleavage/methylation domain-containing protein [Candidatus Omnitrophica bacterium]|nr:prepilin-type N-terminal cleavage/methylation domain-containing protein [Candidatus Omnitrophota bacterium]